jgi:putative transcriptional regulator
MIQPKENTLLIADPFLKDDNFIRSVIYLCSHNDEGSFGLVLNKLFDFTLNNLVSGFESFEIPVYVGGPVALDTIHFLHQYPDLVPDCQQLDENLAWGGDFETIKTLIISGAIDIHKIKFFIGYSGWSAGQLAYSDAWMPETVISALGENGEQWAGAFGATLVILGGLIWKQWLLRQRDPSGNSLAS